MAVTGAFHQKVFDERERLRVVNTELMEDNDRLRALNVKMVDACDAQITELVALLQRLIEASDRRVSALPVIDEARAAIARARGES
jgi:MoxR-like ATPase